MACILEWPFHVEKTRYLYNLLSLNQRVALVRPGGGAIGPSSGFTRFERSVAIERFERLKRLVSDWFRVCNQLIVALQQYYLPVIARRYDYVKTH
jgi:hypothetical protein